MKKLSIIIPAFNEAGSLSTLLGELSRELSRCTPDSEIIIVNNGSTDDTSWALENLSKDYPELRTIHIPVNQGYGNGILAGLSQAHGEVVGWMHADNQFNPKDLPVLYDKLVKEKLDVCKVVRLDRDESTWRKFQSRVYGAIFNLLFGGLLKDVNGSPKLFRQAFLRELHPVSRDWFLDPEVMIKTIQRKGKVGEVPIVWRARVRGKSKANLRASMEFLLNMLKVKTQSIFQ